MFCILGGKSIIVFFFGELLVAFKKNLPLCHSCTSGTKKETVLCLEDFSTVAVYVCILSNMKIILDVMKYFAMRKQSDRQIKIVLGTLNFCLLH